MSSSRLVLDFGERIRQLRKTRGLSQEALAFRAGLDRTYISGIERGVRNVGLRNIGVLAHALGVSVSDLFSGEEAFAEGAAPQPGAVGYRVRDGFEHECGFVVTGQNIREAAEGTAVELRALPFRFLETIDYKTLSTLAGALFASHLARIVGAIVNPIEKGHPDVVPREAADASEAQLRNYPRGLEIKCTIGNVRQGRRISPGVPRIGALTGLTWQAHHQEVESLLGLVIDFAGEATPRGRYPVITAAFFAGDLRVPDWGEISGTKGRNTKVSGMRTSGRLKMGQGWVLLLDDEAYLRRYSGILSFRTA